MVVWSTLVISVLPLLLLSIGLEFDSTYKAPTLRQINESFSTDFRDVITRLLRGAFVHFLLEWSAVGIALFTSVLALMQYRITKNLTTATIGIALLCSGFMDSFHALAATKLIESVAHDENFIPFTWGLSRVFNAFILIAGILVFAVGREFRFRKDRFVLSVGAFFLLFSYCVMLICANSTNLPPTQFPNDLITRPYDVAPLLLFVIIMFWLMPLLIKKDRSYFNMALFWSMVPAIATQLHMVFGSSVLFDSHFNIAHFLKAISYLVPFAGIAFDYIQTYKLLAEKKAETEKANKELNVAIKEMEQFAYVASHDLQEPLKTINMFVDLISLKGVFKKDVELKEYFSFVTQSAERMAQKITALLEYGRIGKKSSLEVIKCHKVIDEILHDLKGAIDESNAVINVGPMPTFRGYRIEVQLLFQNLISNALKFEEEGKRPKIDISAERRGVNWLFSIKDNGIGIDEAHQKKIFVIFQRLHLDEEYSGTGIGLAHCLKIVRLHDGDIWVESSPGEGSTFYFTISNQL